jgi:hypothetical protein
VAVTRRDPPDTQASYANTSPTFATGANHVAGDLILCWVGQINGSYTNLTPHSGFTLVLASSTGNVSLWEGSLGSSGVQTITFTDSNGDTLSTRICEVYPSTVSITDVDEFSFASGTWTSPALTALAAGAQRIDAIFSDAIVGDTGQSLVAAISNLFDTEIERWDDNTTVGPGSSGTRSGSHSGFAWGIGAMLEDSGGGGLDADVAAVMPGLTASAAAYQTAVAATAATMPGLTASASAYQTAVAAVAATMPGLVAAVSASAGSSIDATVAAVMPGLTAAATAYQAGVATTAATMPGLVAAVSARQTAVAAVAATMPGLTAQVFANGGEEVVLTGRRFGRGRRRTRAS